MRSTEDVQGAAAMDAAGGRRAGAFAFWKRRSIGLGSRRTNYIYRREVFSNCVYNYQYY
jgi:hypothetical protein